MSKEMREHINKVKNFGQFLNEGKREKILLGGYETWLDRSGYPVIWLYPTETSKNGIPVDVLYDGKMIGSTDLNDEEKKELLDYLNTNRGTDVISSKNHLTKDEILSTGDWYEADYIKLMEGYFWKHKSIKEDGYVFYMRRYKNDGFTTIVEQGKDDNKLFEGYIKNIDELRQVVHLCRLHEI